MRVYEVITEDKKQLNEAFFLIPGLAWGALMSGLTAYFTITSAYEIWKILDKNGYDPERMTTDDWIDISWEILPLAIPVLGKYIAKGLRRVTPRAAEREIADVIKNQVSKKTNGFRRSRTDPKKPDKKGIKPDKKGNKAATPAAQAAAKAAKDKTKDAAKDAAKDSLAGKVAKGAAKVTGAGVGLTLGGKEVLNRMASDSGAGTKPSSTHWVQDPGKGKPGSSIDWDPLGTIDRLNKIYGK